MDIHLVRTEQKAEQVRALAWESIDWLRGRYPEQSNSIDEYLINQNFKQQLAELLIHFCPPAGECLLAELDWEAAGIVMLKASDNGTGEMNRMFVRAAARRQGIGRALCLRLIERARELGYDSMVLSALDQHREALPLYRSLGFVDDKRDSDTQGTRQFEVLMRLQL